MKNGNLRGSKKLLALTFIGVFLSQLALSQTLYEYDSLYQPLIGFSGHANFKYSINNNGDRIREGAFRFESKKTDSICGTKLYSVRWNGDYRQNKKVGDWEYLDVEHQLDLNDIDDDFNVSYNLLSRETLINAQYVNGNPNGKWELESNLLKDGVKHELIKAVDVRIDKLKFTGEVDISGEDDSTQNYTIKGKAEAGLMVGNWVFSYTEDSTNVHEERYFSKGFLQKLIKINKSTGDTLVNLSFPLDGPVMAYLEGESPSSAAANTPLSLTYSDGYPRTSSYIIEQGRGNHLLEKTLRELLKFEPDFIKNNGLPLGTNRIIYPLSASEKRMLKIWPELEYNFRDKVTALNELGLSNFKFGENDTLRFMQQWVEKQIFIIKYIKPWNNIFSLNEIEFYNREGILYEYARTLLSTDSIKVDDELYLVPYEVPEQTANSFLPYVTENFNERIKVADSLYNLYEDILTKLSLADNIQTLTERITEKKGTLDSLYSSTGNSNEAERRLIDSIERKFLDTYFKNKYSSFLNNTITATLQKEIGDSLIFNLNHLEGAYNKINSIFSRTGLIDSLYTDFVFDPYTFNDRFPIRIKKKLYQFVAEDLFADLINEAINARTIRELEKTLNHLENMQERLIFLVDKDTKKLERQLKQRMSINEKLEILKIE